MCRIVLLCWFVSCCFLSYAGERDVLFRINGDTTSVGEFEHYYTRIHAVNGISAEHFLSHFLCYKLKVADAKRQGWDTLPDYRLQCNILQNEMWKTMQEGKKNLAPMKWVKFCQISIFLPQHASAERERKARTSMDSVYAALKAGASFERVAQNYSSNAGVSLYADGEWIPEICLVKEFSEQLDALKKNDYSAPFFSPLGIHVVRLLDFKQGNYPGLVSDTTDLCATKVEPDSWSLKQISDGLLAAYWDKRHTEDKSGRATDEDLRNYFDAHKKDYAWSLPHFKGGVIHCLSKKAASKLKKRLKKLPLSEWAEEVAASFQEDSSMKAEVETGLFQIGKNPYIDKLAFKCGHFTSRTDLPYTFILGKRLKKGPEEWMDVHNEVVRDYRLWMEKSQMEELQQNFKIEINQDILKTVNCSGKK